MIAFEMLKQIQSSIGKYPTSFAKWANVMLFEVHPLREIAVIGKKSKEIAKQIFNQYLPNRVIMATDTENQTYPLLEGKTAGIETLIFVLPKLYLSIAIKISFRNDEIFFR
jgi:uncharacterized protein YyaL (SSP411 family)